MNAVWLVMVSALVLMLAYRFYGAFLAAKVLALDPARRVPSETHQDGRDFMPTNKWVLLGHHFAAIAGAGPLIGPVLAAQFGWLPGTLWILIGAVLAGAVHDAVILLASVRHQGRSIAEIAREIIGPRMGFITSVAVLLILVIAMAGLGIPVVNALKESPWGTFTVGWTIPVAIFIGLYLKFIRPGKIAEATVIGVGLILLGVAAGPYVKEMAWARFISLDAQSMSVALAAYGFLAAALPVWLLLLPRDYLSTYMKLGVIFALAAGILIVHPDLKMPAVTQFVNGGGPVIPGKLFPFLFITIACGALSGFHALISSGTTPKLIRNERDILPIGFGAMLLEAFVAIMAIIAATVLPMADYFAINAKPEAFAALGMVPEQLNTLSRLAGEDLTNRPGGAVTLAAGMTWIFHKALPFERLMGFWYHFCIMFEALFILTTIDAGTRVGRYLLQDFAGYAWKPFADKARWGNILLFSALVSAAWGWLLYTGDVKTIWPLFGVANQMLGVIAFGVGTAFLIRIGKAKYVWTTLVPMAFVLATTLSAAVLNITQNFLPKKNYLLVALSTMLMPVVAVLLVGVTTLLSSWYWGLLVASGVWYGAATGAAVSFQAWQNAARDRRSATTAQIADVWLRIAIAIVLVQLVPDGRLAVAGYAIGSGLVALWQYARARRALHAAGTAVVTDHEQEDSRQEFIRFSLPFAGYALFTVVSLYGDRWLLQQFDGVVAVGIYAAIYQLAASPVNILFAIVNQLMIPLVYEQAGVAGSGAVVPAARRLIVVTVWGVLAVLTVGGVLLSIFQYWVVALCTASSFVPYASLLVLVFWGLGLFQLGQILTLYGNCAGLPGIYLLAKIVHAVALGIFGVMLIPRMGVFGMGWALVAASLLYLMAIVLVNRRLAFSSGGCHV
jgi:carbon starvation protein